MSQKPRISLRAKAESTHGESQTAKDRALDTPIEHFLGQQLLSDQTQSIGKPIHPALAAEKHPYYRPKKKQISIRLDCDVLEWFQSMPGKYQQHINRVCRAYMLANLNQQVMVQEEACESIA